ncbi:hypothetical protein [Brevundimonas goettingensis]|uniref:DUF3617 family protein n=1 Tax=Brevundimonas goettingensis TaxID=2774190 RepID=A0A975C2A0_9CAUL|nr:hypothetical protein [Brevundimonas goettingensis]QTC90021.1 hypothetical protein IFJ75_12055 [Brevundimonas goettingensis]
MLAGLAGLAGCDRSRVNPPTEPAKAITSPIVDATAEAPSDSMAPLMPGTGPTSFIGRWSADPALCAAPQGNRRPLEITTMRFEGPEGGCDIARIDQVTGGYQATLSCPAPNGAHVERVQMSVVGQTLDVAYVDRRGPDGTPRSVKLLKCTTLTDTASKAPSLPVP